MKNIDMTKVEKVSNGSDLLVNATMNANKFIENVWNQHEVNDEIAERAENAKNIVQNLLGNYMISFDSEDSEVLDCIRAYYDRMDDLVHDEQNLTAFLDMPRDFEILTTLMKETSPAVTTLGLTYLTSAVMQYFDVEDLPAWPEGMSRHDLMMQSIAGLSRELLYVPEFKNSLIFTLDYQYFLKFPFSEDISLSKNMKRKNKSRLFLDILTNDCSCDESSILKFCFQKR